MSKTALYVNLAMSRLEGKIEGKDEVIDLEIGFRNEYPRFIIILNKDVSIPYFDRTKTIQMSSEIYAMVIRMMREFIYDGINQPVEVLYPDYKGDKNNKVIIGTFSMSKDDHGVYSLVISFDGKKAYFPLVSSDKFFRREMTDEQRSKYHNAYIDVLENIAINMPLLISARMAREVPIK